jgi:alpha-tubulin suppressor-like RCC1 family protein
MKIKIKLAMLPLLGLSSIAYADSYDPETNQLTIPTITVEGTTYENVLIRVGNVLSYNEDVDLAGTEDSYDPVTNILTIPYIVVNEMAYTNVKVTVGLVLRLTKSVSYDPATNQLTISTITVAGKTYNNVLITLGEVLSYNTGTPGAALSYDPATNILTIPLITVDGLTYSNVKVTVGAVLSFDEPPLPTETTKTATDFTSVFSNGFTTAAFKSDGSLWMWGFNGNGAGQFGDGTTTNSLVPKQIGTDYTTIALGSLHTVALKSDGTLWAWGHNAYGQLGDGTRTGSPVPKRKRTGFTKIAAADYQTLALKENGSLWAWGKNSCTFRQVFGTDILLPIQIGTGYTDIAAGGNSMIALKSDGSLWAGKLGCVNQSLTDSFVLKQIDTDQYTAIWTSGLNSFAAKSDGSLWAWGYNNEGQLGDGTLIPSFVPKQVGTGFTKIAQGPHHTVGLKADGSLWTWGRNYQNQFGNGVGGSLIPLHIGTGFTDIGSGGDVIVAVKSDSSLWVQGSNYFGQFGDGTTNPGSVTNAGRKGSGLTGTWCSNHGGNSYSDSYSYYYSNSCWVFDSETGSTTGKFYQNLVNTLAIVGHIDYEGTYAGTLTKTMSWSIDTATQALAYRFTWAEQINSSNDYSQAMSEPEQTASFQFQNDGSELVFEGTTYYRR